MNKRKGGPRPRATSNPIRTFGFRRNRRITLHSTPVTGKRCKGGVFCAGIPCGDHQRTECTTKNEIIRCMSPEELRARGMHVSRRCHHARLLQTTSFLRVRSEPNLTQPSQSSFWPSGLDSLGDLSPYRRRYDVSVLRAFVHALLNHGRRPKFPLNISGHSEVLPESVIFFFLERKQTSETFELSEYLMLIICVVCSEKRCGEITRNRPDGKTLPKSARFAKEHRAIYHPNPEFPCFSRGGIHYRSKTGPAQEGGIMAAVCVLSSTRTARLGRESNGRSRFFLRSF